MKKLQKPCPYGYNFYFIKNNWGIVRPHILRIVLCFQEMGHILHGYNASFITLVPKRNNPTNLNDFRPISLVGCVYKVIFKVLANRIKRVLPLVIDKSQLACLSGRGLLDSVLVANETVDYLKRGKLR